MGLKLHKFDEIIFIHLSSNRTIVGLKPRLIFATGKSNICSNRTIVGLKLCGAPAFLPCTNSQQSHHCGIETQLREGKRFCISERQQSHHCGIETYNGTEGVAVVWSSSNRTIVGLKPCRNLHTTILHPQQQSHHCGIETKPRHIVGVKQKTGSNRTIVGLKLQSHLRVPINPRGSNRTIVGLKRVKVYVRKDGGGLQQSHHCGIETRQQSTLPPPKPAQQSHHCGIETCIGT